MDDAGHIVPVGTPIAQSHSLVSHLRTWHEQQQKRLQLKQIETQKTHQKLDGIAYGDNPLSRDHVESAFAKDQPRESHLAAYQLPAESTDIIRSPQADRIVMAGPTNIGSNGNKPLASPPQSEALPSGDDIVNHSSGAGRSAPRPFLRKGTGLVRFRMKPGKVIRLKPSANKMEPPADSGADETRTMAEQGKTEQRVMLRSKPRGNGPSPQSRTLLSSPPRGAWAQPQSSLKLSPARPRAGQRSKKTIIATRSSPPDVVIGRSQAGSGSVGVPAAGARITGSRLSGEYEVGDVPTLRTAPMTSSRSRFQTRQQLEPHAVPMGLRRDGGDALVAQAGSADLHDTNEFTPQKKRELKELHAFEVLEQAAEDSSFCSTSSFINNILSAASSTPQRGGDGRNPGPPEVISGSADAHSVVTMSSSLDVPEDPHRSSLVSDDDVMTEVHRKEGEHGRGIVAVFSQRYRRNEKDTLPGKMYHETFTSTAPESGVESVMTDQRQTLEQDMSDGREDYCVKADPLEKYKRLLTELRLVDGGATAVALDPPPARRSVRFNENLNHVHEITADDVSSQGDATLTTSDREDEADPAEDRWQFEDNEVEDEVVSPDVSSQEPDPASDVVEHDPDLPKNHAVSLQFSPPERRASRGPSEPIRQAFGGRSEHEELRQRQMKLQQQHQEPTDAFQFDPSTSYASSVQAKKHEATLMTELDTFRRENEFLSKMRNDLLDQKLLMEKERQDLANIANDQKGKWKIRFAEERKRLDSDKKSLEMDKKRFYDEKKKRDAPEMKILQAKVAELESELRRRDASWSADSTRLRARLSRLQADNERLVGQLDTARHDLARQNARQFYGTTPASSNSGSGSSVGSYVRVPPAVPSSRGSSIGSLTRHRSAPSLMASSALGSGSSRRSAPSHTAASIKRRSKEAATSNSGEKPARGRTSSRAQLVSETSTGSALPRVRVIRESAVLAANNDKEKVAARSAPLPSVPPLTSAPLSPRPPVPSDSAPLPFVPPLTSAPFSPRPPVPSDPAPRHRPLPNTFESPTASLNTLDKNHPHFGSVSGKENRPSTVSSPDDSPYGTAETGRTRSIRGGHVTKTSGQPALISTTSSMRREAPASTRQNDSADIYNNNESESSGRREDILMDGTRRVSYPNGDWKETSTAGDVVYFYAGTNTRHTTYSNKAELIELSNGQVERRDPSGTVETRHPCGSLTTLLPSGEELTVYPDGTRQRTLNDGTIEVLLPEGKLEVHTPRYKKLVCPDGTVKFLYADGRQETRYPEGRVRIKDKHGALIVDTQP